MPIIVLEFVKTQVWYSEETDTALSRPSIKDRPLLAYRQTKLFLGPPPPPKPGRGGGRSMNELNLQLHVCI